MNLIIQQMWHTLCGNRCTRSATASENAEFSSYVQCIHAWLSVHWLSESSLIGYVCSVYMHAYSIQLRGSVNSRTYMCKSVWWWQVVQQLKSLSKERTILTLGAHAQWELQYLVCHSVRPSVCHHLFSHYAQQGGQKSDTNRFSATLGWFLKWWFLWIHWFKSYGMKHKRKSQYASEYCLTLTDLCRFAHCGSIGSYTKVKLWVNSCIQTLTTDTAIQ